MPDPINRLARRALSSRLRALRTGAITITDPLGKTRFGPAACDPVRVTVRRPRFYRRAATGGALGVAASYLDADWDTDDLPALLRLFARDIAAADHLSSGAARFAGPARRLWAAARRNTRAGARRNIAGHYDLGNDLFKLFLDDTLTYSCAVFETPETSLLDASLAKLDRVCRALDLQPSDHLVELGSGWGSLAIHAAANYGCRVTTTTISKQQRELATQRVRDAGLEERIEIRADDYRDLPGKYDKLAAIEMIEAVGHDYLPEFFENVARLLKPGGAACLQAITMPDDRYDAYLRSTDFIRRYVFPGSCCPAMKAIRAAAEPAGFAITKDDVLTPHYAETLRRWRTNFNHNLESVRALGYPERFIRLWNYYLAYCEAGFAENYIAVRQLTLTNARAETAPTVTIPAREKALA